uniref:Uncharacterized protein n=1 Tax=Setaria viridis TaxID=4556 RepID=A0A4U6VMU6_SETVI|nr:hypothetical protein SEVIR_2G079432v2 [Setaria viridis]
MGGLSPPGLRPPPLSPPHHRLSRDGGSLAPARRGGGGGGAFLSRKTVWAARVSSPAAMALLRRSAAGFVGPLAGSEGPLVGSVALRGGSASFCSVGQGCAGGGARRSALRCGWARREDD